MRKLTTKRCKQCRNVFMPERPLQYLCGPKCAWEYADKRAKEVSRKEWNIKKRAMQEKLKTLSDYEKLARIIFQKWIRKRDEGLPCISCGKTNVVQWHGGHYLKAELFTGLIFDPDNCHSQCSRCNDLYSGNELEYRDGLIKRYGEQFVLNLESKKEAARFYKFTKDELIAIASKYKSMLKSFQQ